MKVSIALLATALLSYSAQVPQPGSLHVVTGTVVNSVTDQPIGRALVRLYGSVQLSAFTGSDGRFQFDDIAEGTVALTTERPGYLATPLGVAYNGSVHVTSGTNDFRLTLTPQANVEGTVLDSEGEPIDSLQIQVLTESVIEGRRRWMQASVAATDESGAYRIEDLPPGLVILRTQAKPRFINARNMPHLTYASRYYPEGTDLASAQPIDLKPGETARADFKLIADPGFVLSGTVAGVPSGTEFWLGPESADIEMAPAYQIRAGNGRFLIEGVTAGTWTYHFQANDRAGKLLEAELSVAVSGSDVKGLSAVLQPNAEIPVVLNHASTSSSLQLQLVAANASFSQQGQSVAGNSGLVLQNVRAGQYSVVARTSGPECLDSIFSGSTDLTRNSLIVAPGSRPQPIVVNLRSDCATVSGFVRPSDPSLTGTVLITCDSPSFQPITAPVQGDGKFSVEGLSPGSYLVYAFSTVENLEYANPQVMRGYQAQELVLSSNQKANVTLDLIRRERGK